MLKKGLVFPLENSNIDLTVLEIVLKSDLSLPLVTN